MKFKFLVFLFFSLFVSIESFSASKPTVNLTSPRWLYVELSKTFPELKESIGGFSYEISLKELRCTSSNILQKEEALISVECTAKNYNGNTLTRQAPTLFLALVNSKVKIDRNSEPGTSYIELQNLDCSVVDPKPTNPKDEIAPEYSCSASKN